MTQPTAPAVGDSAAASGQAALLAWLGGDTRTYTPALTATTTNPTLGTSSNQVGRYSRIGNQVNGEGLIQFGTGGTNAGSGVYLVSMPTAVDASIGVGMLVGSFTAKCAGLFTRGDLYLNTAATGLCRLVYTSVAINGSYVSTAHNAPGAWTANDSIQFAFQYLAP